jgi:hypothetical protein
MRTVICIVFLLMSAVTAHAASITLLSESNGTYSYGLTIEPGETFTMETAATMGLTGLSDVTSASTFDSISVLFNLGFNPTEVALINISGFTISTPGTLVGFELTSTAATTGNVTYHITASDTEFTGTVLGPVAPTSVPTPPTLLLVTTGLGMMVVRRTRTFKALTPVADHTTRQH